MADTALSTVNRSSTGSRAGCSPQGWEGCLVCSFCSPCLLQSSLLQVMLLLDQHLVRGCIQTLQLQRAMLTAALAAPVHPQLPADFCSSPASLTPHADSSIQCWNMWASLHLAPCYWPDGCTKMVWGRTVLSWRVRRRVEEKLSPEEWCQGDNPVWSEEGNCLWILSWQHQTQSRIFHGLRKYLHFPVSQTQELKRQSFSFWF